MIKFIFDCEPIILELVEIYMLKSVMSVFSSIYKRFWFLNYPRYKFLPRGFSSVVLLDLYDYSLLLLVFSPSGILAKLVCKYWHLSPYLQNPFVKKFTHDFVLYFRLSSCFSLISYYAWAKAHWNKAKNYEFVEGAKSFLEPESTFLTLKQIYLGFVLSPEIDCFLILFFRSYVLCAHAVPGLF